MCAFYDAPEESGWFTDGLPDRWVSCFNWKSKAPYKEPGVVMRPNHLESITVCQRPGDIDDLLVFAERLQMEHLQGAKQAVQYYRMPAIALANVFSWECIQEIIEEYGVHEFCCGPADFAVMSKMFTKKLVSCSDIEKEFVNYVNNRSVKMNTEVMCFQEDIKDPVKKHFFRSFCYINPPFGMHVDVKQKEEHLHEWMLADHNMEVINVWRAIKYVMRFHPLYMLVCTPVTLSPFIKKNLSCIELFEFTYPLKGKTWHSKWYHDIKCEFLLIKCNHQDYWRMCEIDYWSGHMLITLNKCPWLTSAYWNKIMKCRKQFLPLLTQDNATYALNHYQKSVNPSPKKQCRNESDLQTKDDEDILKSNEIEEIVKKYITYDENVLTPKDVEKYILSLKKNKFKVATDDLRDEQNTEQCPKLFSNNDSWHLIECDYNDKLLRSLIQENIVGIKKLSELRNRLMSTESYTMRSVLTINNIHFPVNCYSCGVLSSDQIIVTRATIESLCPQEGDDFSIKCDASYSDSCHGDVELWSEEYSCGPHYYCSFHASLPKCPIHGSKVFLSAALKRTITSGEWKIKERLSKCEWPSLHHMGHVKIFGSKYYPSCENEHIYCSFHARFPFCHSHSNGSSKDAMTRYFKTRHFLNRCYCCSKDDVPLSDRSTVKVPIAVCLQCEILKNKTQKLHEISEDGKKTRKMIPPIKWKCGINELSELDSYRLNVKPLHYNISQKSKTNVKFMRKYIMNEIDEDLRTRSNKLSELGNTEDILSSGDEEL